MGIPDPILVPVLILAGCAFVAAWYGARAYYAPRHSSGDPARCPVCRSAPAGRVDPVADNRAIRRRLVTYVAGRQPGRAK